MVMIQRKELPEDLAITEPGTCFFIMTDVVELRVLTQFGNKCLYQPENRVTRVVFLMGHKKGGFYLQRCFLRNIVLK